MNSTSIISLRLFRSQAYFGKEKYYISLNILVLYTLSQQLKINEKTFTNKR